ncbi:hypothetical protein HD806DRAFT_538961 [Xylariaceae sp. AK1471]|nr:hypothetical protein HD806DRAFT_538961 [Xylariaceae sp. AK1471]
MPQSELHLPPPRTNVAQAYEARIQRLYNQSLRKSLFSIQCRRLAEYLRSTQSQAQALNNHFAWLYSFSEEAVPEARAFSIQNLHHAKNNADTNQLLFLSGYPSKELLLHLGGLFDIDPAFFDTHLSFIGNDVTSCDVHPSYYTLPSHQQTIFQTSVPCIGGAPEDPRYGNLLEKRRVFSTRMEEYLRDLRIGANWNTSDSIVRAVEVHDTRRFSLQQNITVLIKYPEGSTSWLIVVWSDAGANLTSIQKGPWFDSLHGVANTHFRPVTLIRKTASVDLDGHMNSEQTEVTFGLHQTITLLRQAYGTSIDPALSSEHPIYALSELFAFVAVSIGQYLDVIRSVLDDNISITGQNNANKRSEVQDMLSFSYNCLERRRDQTVAMLTFLKGQLDQIEAVNSPALLLIIRDYEYLLKRNHELMTRCDHEWNVIMSKAAVEDAKWSRDQSKNQFKFVLLATIYVPLSFSCSIFGMTFFQLESLQRGFIIWSAVTVPLFITSFLFLFWSPKYVKNVREMSRRRIQTLVNV